MENSSREAICPPEPLAHKLTANDVYALFYCLCTCDPSQTAFNIEHEVHKDEATPGCLKCICRSFGKYVHIVLKWFDMFHIRAHINNFDCWKLIPDCMRTSMIDFLENVENDLDIIARDIQNPFRFSIEVQTSSTECCGYSKNVIIPNQLYIKCSAKSLLLSMCEYSQVAKRCGCESGSDIIVETKLWTAPAFLIFHTKSLAGGKFDFERNLDLTHFYAQHITDGPTYILCAVLELNSSGTCAYVESPSRERWIKVDAVCEVSVAMIDDVFHVDPYLLFYRRQ